MTDNVNTWLCDLGLGRYATVFAENDIDFDVLAELTDPDLRDLGVSLGHRKRLLKAIRDIGRDRGGHRASDDAERRQLTVMFCDLVGSTELSVQMDPEALREVLSQFQKCCELVAQRLGGHIARYMGDGLLVYFGYPRAHENNPELAIHAGLEIIRAVGDLHALDDVRLRTRVGIATGDVVVGGLIGAGSAREQSVIGEAPNRAARLQALAEPDQVVICDGTRKLARGLFEFADLGQHSLKGFDKPVSAWGVRYKLAVDSRFEAIHPTEALAPLVSREREIEHLLDNWVSALAGNGRAVLISGEAGIGKSRLAHALPGRLAAVPHVVLRYFCLPHFQNTALFPMIRQLESAAGIRSADESDTRLSKLESLLSQTGVDASKMAPFLAALLSISVEGRYPPLDLSPQLWLEKTLQALERLLVALVRDRPALIIFEDLHWIDSTTLELLARAVRRVRDLPVLLVMTARPDFEPPWQDSSSISTLHLDRLTRADATVLALNVASASSLPDEVIEQIMQKADGVPLFIEELTKMAVESDLLRKDNGAYALTGPTFYLSLPDTLQDLLMARLDRLSEARELAQIGAVIGRQFSHWLLTAVSPFDPDRLDRGIHELLATGMVSKKGDAPLATYTFKHALIQDSAYSLLLGSKRRKLHEKIAETLQEQSPDIRHVRPETLAHHYSSAAKHAEAIEYWHRAAISATERAAHTDAIEHVGKALALLARLPVDAEHIRTEIALQVTLGRNREATLGYAAPEVAQTFQRARDLCQMLGETIEQVPVLLGLGVHHLVRGNLAETHELADQCVRLADEAGQIDYLTESCTLLQFALCFRGRLVESHEIAWRCISLYESRRAKGFSPISAQDPCVSALSREAITLWQLGRPDASLECLDRGLALAEELSQPISVVQLRTHAAQLYQLRGEPEKAAVEARESIRVASEHGYDYWRLLSELHLGVALGVLGEHSEGLKIAERAVNALIAAGADADLTYRLGGLAQIHRAAGRAEEALALINRAFVQIKKTDEQIHVAMLHIWRGECRLELAEPDWGGAEADFLRAISHAVAQRAHMLRLRATCRLCRLRDVSGKKPSVRQSLHESVDLLAEGADTLDVIQARALLA